ncbi:MAG: archaetidylserine decarboxylase [Nannocystaceae bacterium]|nr:phosphatidylserine decarboxylase [Myxococcales bacterium]
MAEVDPVRHQEGYDTFDAFFTRKLRDGARPVSRAARTVIAPSDGLVREVLPIEGGVEIRAKGTEYTLGDLLASDELAREFVGGTATTIYLHPRDYHRVHCPCDALALEVVHIPGRMLPVNDAALAREPRLFARNERIVHVLETMHGKMVVVMIAAFGVGHMSCAYRRLEPHPQALVRVPCDPPARLRKADELGVFHLGSTVILVTAPGVHPVGGEVPRRVRMGQALLEGGVSA